MILIVDNSIVFLWFTGVLATYWQSEIFCGIITQSLIFLQLRVLALDSTVLGGYKLRI